MYSTKHSESANLIQKHVSSLAEVTIINGFHASVYVQQKYEQWTVIPDHKLTTSSTTVHSTEVINNYVTTPTAVMVHHKKTSKLQ